MRTLSTLWILCSLLVTASGSHAAEASTPRSPELLEELAWISGAWSSTGDGVLAEEHWTTPAGGMMLGLHRDVREDGTFFEYLRIEETAEGIQYVASPQGGPATAFRLTDSTPGRAVFENPAHDFPQRIVYTRDGDTLCAGIAATGEDPKPERTWCWQRGSL